MYQEKKELTITERQHPCLVGWRKRRDEAVARGKFTSDDISDASTWDMCAIGEARISGFSIPMCSSFSQYRGPMDEKLRNLGGRFAGAVLGNKFWTVDLLLTAIENRLSELFPTLEK